MEKFITLDHLKKTVQSLILDTDSKINGLPIAARTGDYNDLINKPTIPAAQVQSDWNATTGMGVILNKPTIPTVTNTYLASSSDAMSGIAVNSAISTAIQNINITYSLSISGNVITLTGSDNTTSNITLPVYNGEVS